jgi:hypothetical protein
MDMNLSSTFGGQKSSSRRTAPSFGFGAATREVANKVFVSQEHTALATAGMHSPGPAKYDMPPSIGGTQPEGRKASAPSYGFSKGARFMTEREADRTPGPGAGGFHPAIGPQPVGRFASAPMAGFGSGTREARSKLFISHEHNRLDNYGQGSPGPATIALPSTMGKQFSSAISSAGQVAFSQAGRDDPRAKQLSKEKANMPGPGGTYKIDPSVGKQISSRYASAPQAGFGTSEVSHQQKLYQSQQHEKMHFGKLSPGPLAPYQIDNSIGRQLESKDASQPSWGFGSADRWAAYNKEVSSNTTPGPGNYDPVA